MSQTRYHLNATLLPDGNQPSDLWIIDGRLTIQPQDGAESLAPAGGYVLPGLVDCHAHLTLDAGRHGLPLGSRELVAANRRDQLAAGVLFVRDIGAASDATLALPADDGLPRVQPAGRFLAPQGKYFAFGQFVGADRLSSVAAAQVAAGARWVKIIADFGQVQPDGTMRGPTTANYDPDVLAGAVAAVHAAGGRVAVHAMRHDAIAMSVAAGVDSIEHGLEMDAALLREMAARGIGWTPTLSAIRQIAAAVTQAAALERLRGNLEQLRDLIPRAHRLGIPILAGTDTLPHGAIAQEVHALQEMGLQPNEALGAASTAARAFLGVPGLEEGAAADLVLYAADPRNDPELLGRPQLTLLGGQRV